METRTRASCKVTARLLAVVALLWAAPAWSQTNVGLIGGRVMDSLGGALPGCSVTATNDQSRSVATTVTDAQGVYVFPSLPAGRYTLKAELEGFQTIVQSGVILDAASRRSVDLHMRVGSITESVSVAAPANQVETASGDIGRLITGEQVARIALNGRNYAQLAQLVPGVVTTSTDPFNLGLSTTGQFINGIASRSTYFTVDGADNMDSGANGNTLINPSLDTIGEITVLTSSYSAEFGGRAGAMINVVTKSGGNEFRGSAYGLFRDESLDARSFFEQEKAPLDFYDFGWTLGGPIFVPKRWNAERTRLFFFVGQEWKYNHTPVSRISTVPTLEERQGDFANSSLSAPIDPLTRQPFPNRTVPASRFSRNGPALLAAYPLPNFTGPGGNYLLTAVDESDTRQDHIRLDYHPTDRINVMGRFTRDDVDILEAFQGGDLGIVPGARPRPGWSSVVSVSWTPTNTLVNSFAVSVNANRIEGEPRNGVVSRASLGLGYPEIFPANRFSVGPNVNIAGFTGFEAGDFIRNRARTIQLRDDLSKVIGSHALKFGAQVTFGVKDQNTAAPDNGEVTFSTSARDSTRNVIADVLLGNFQNYTEAQSDQEWWARFRQYELYAQDHWRVNDRLTLDLGLRYSIIPWFYSALGNFGTFVPERFDPAVAPSINSRDGSIVPGAGNPTNGIVLFGPGFPDAAAGRIPVFGDPAMAGLFVGLPKSGVPTNYGDMGPRLGFAWDPFGSGRTAIRGGFGMFYDLMRSAQAAASAANPPFDREANVFDGNIDDPAGGVAAPPFPPNLSGIRDRMPTPTVYTFNLGVQRAIGFETILHANLVGTLGRNRNRVVNINQLPPGTRLSPPASTTNVNALRPYPGYANINIRENADRSNYRSLQLSAVRRLAAGLSFAVNYTWSRAFDSSAGSVQDVYDIEADYGRSPIHRSHILNANFTYELPFFRRSPSALLSQVFGGWDLAGIFMYQSGAPFNVTVPADVARIGVNSSRASLVPGADPRLPAGERTPEHWFNTSAFLPPQEMTPGRFGDSPRGVLIGPRFMRADLSLSKSFGLGRDTQLQLRAEAFNVFNTVSFTSLNTTVRFDSTGNPTRGFGAVTAAAPGRSLALGARLTF